MKLTSIELKKYFKNPTSYIVSALLIIVMLVSIMTYSPTLGTKSDIIGLYENYEVNIESFDSVHDYFYNDLGSHLSKKWFDENVSASKIYLDSHNPNVEANNVLNELNKHIEEINSLYDTDNTSKISYHLQQFKSTYTKATDLTTANETAVITKSAQNTLSEIITQAENILAEDGSYAGLSNLQRILKLKDELNLTTKLSKALSGVKNYLPSKQDYNEALNYYNKATNLITEINTRIEALPANSQDVNLLFKYIEEYSQVSDSIYAIITKQIQVSAIFNIGEKESKNYIGLNNINTYEYKEQLTKQKYLLNYFEEHETYLDYVEPINICYTYIKNVNIADYVGFVCTLCSFVIIVYISIMGAVSVNSEFNSGTIRLIATKPINKKKIISSKIWATILYGFILTCITFVVSLIMGGIAYGFITSPVLLIINATTALTLNIYLELILFLLTLLIQIVLFASAAVLISTLVKNKIIAALVSCILYFGSILFNIINVNLPFIPFTSINLWKYFGGSFLLNNSKNFLATLFTSLPINTSSFLINLISIAVFSLIFIILSIIIYRKKEIK